MLMYWLMQCSSSLERIMSSTEVLQVDIREIKDFIRASSRSQSNQLSTLSFVSVADDDEILQTSLRIALMENAEVLQPWDTIGADQWIQAGKWWLLKVCSNF
jgi:hypothetical protein